MKSAQEKKDQRVAMITSLGIHAAVVLLMIFIAAWRAPNPPLPEYGIELNFGTDDAGSGDVQPDQPVMTSETSEQTDPQPSNEDISSTEEVEQDQTENDQAQPLEEETSAVESTVTVPEKREEIKTQQPVETNVKPVEQKVEPKPKVVYQPKNKSTAEGTDADKQGKATSQGDSKKETGDKGDDEGHLDADALYGKQGGGGGGPRLDLAGWLWDEIPRPDVADNESGRIVFEIKVNEEGLIQGIRTLESTVSPASERICREAIQRLTFTKTGANVPEISTGKITFVIRSK
jgi:periplasmic protein TonB